MKTQISPISVTISTLRENARNFNHVADVLEATEKLQGGSVAGIRLEPTLVKRRKMSTATKKKIAAAQKARHAARGSGKDGSGVRFDGTSRDIPLSQWDVGTDGFLVRQVVANEADRHSGIADSRQNPRGETEADRNRSPGK